MQLVHSSDAKSIPGRLLVMHVCLDVGYDGERANVARVGFLSWKDEVPRYTCATCIVGVKPYVPGQFYERELPCLMAALERLDSTPQSIVVDGHVRLDDSGRAGLGMRLFTQLNRAAPVIGVAKSGFHGLTNAISITRGDSTRPLFITAAGISESYAATCIQQMHGQHRMPKLLKMADQISRGLVAPSDI